MDAERLTTEPPVSIRPAGPADAEVAAEVLLRSRSAAFPAVPRSVHPDGDVRRWVRDELLPAGGGWLAESAGRAVGVLVARAGWVDQLYVLPEWTGRGVGSALLAVAKAGHDALQLWTFQSNPAAQRFYERHGFVAVERTDGAANEERSPDVRYAWARPATAAPPASAAGTAGPSRSSARGTAGG